MGEEAPHGESHTAQGCGHESQGSRDQQQSGIIPKDVNLTTQGVVEQE